MSTAIRTIQELLDHEDLSTTMIYTHATNRDGLGVRSQTVRGKFTDRYNAVPRGEYVILLNSQGLLEIARHLANAGAELSDAAVGDTLQINISGSAATN